MSKKPTNKHVKLKGIWLLLILPAVILFHQRAAADRNLRCQGRLVSIGATQAEVRDACEEPDKLDRWQEADDRYISQIYDYKTERYTAPKGFRGPILMERWTYNLGSNRFIRYLYFQNGELIKIETGGKGSD